MHIRRFTVIPALPKPLLRLRDLAHNLWWSWNTDAYELFRRLETDLWDEVQHSPIRLLSLLGQRRLEQVAADTAYLAHLDRVLDRFHAYMHRRTWFDEKFPDLKQTTIAYFSMEFGIHECLPIYSGGLGVLSGEHLKSASELGLPLVAVGLLYRQGYFQQRLAADGWQLEEFSPLDYYQLPISPVSHNGDKQLIIEIDIAGRKVSCAIWKVQVGRVALYLLDTDLHANAPEDREITCRLYGGDIENRIRQEMVLGIGGIRALDALGITPAVVHMNEGHSAFQALERIRLVMQRHGLQFAEAREAIVPSHVFTTHTPVPAGIDRFEPALVKKYLGDYAREMDLSPEELVALGKAQADSSEDVLNMAVLALRLSGFANGVSELHGRISRQMWHNVWPAAPLDEIPIRSITNGIHIPTWMSLEMRTLLDRYIGPDWAENPADHRIWEKVNEIPDLELWRAHERMREKLIAFARRRVKDQLRRRGAPPADVKAADEWLDPEALTIGFARRFAPYKRGALIFRDPDRLARILANPDRPVQLIFGGKAHPRDDRGKEIIKQILTFAKRPEFRRRIVFLENHDMDSARYLVQGVNVWLNNPIKPLEASGTSGMKVAPNGGLNMSVLDGWWPEAFDGENGWAIGDGQIYEDPEYQNYVEADAMYELLEKEIVPMFYDRGGDGVSHRWIARMKASIRTICPLFNTNRMLEEYARDAYGPAAHRFAEMSANDYAASKQLAAWKASMHGRWGEIRVENIEGDFDRELTVGSTLQVKAHVRLEHVSPDEVAVELYQGPLDTHGQIVEGRSEPMTCADPSANGVHEFVGKFVCQHSGRHAFAVRAVPKHAHSAHRYDTGLILWG